jgi:hypothetical protein
VAVGVAWFELFKGFKLCLYADMDHFFLSMNFYKNVDETQQTDML